MFPKMRLSTSYLLIKLFPLPLIVLRKSMLRRGQRQLVVRVGCRHQSSAAATPFNVAGTLPHTPASVMGPIVAYSKGMRSDPISLGCAVVGWSLFVCTYLIMVDWIYTGYLELWDGVYGIEDDDEDDE